MRAAVDHNTRGGASAQRESFDVGRAVLRAGAEEAAPPGLWRVKVKDGAAGAGTVDGLRRRLQA